MKYDTKSIQQKLSRFPNAELSITPTPIYKLFRLSSHLGSSVYIMREDLTGFAIGGNKNRKLDFLIGDALAGKADALITTKASSFSRNAAAAGKVFGFEVHVVMDGEESEQNRASQALFQLFDANLHYVPAAAPKALAAEYQRVVSELENSGKRVYELHPGGSDAIGSLGYLNAFDQIVQYSQQSAVHFDKIIHSTGSTATQVGLLMGQQLSDYRTTIIGMAASQPTDIQIERIHDLALTTAQLLGLQFDKQRIVVEDGFIGPGYAIESEEGRKAARIFANLEGVLLDDVYTGKAAAGLIQYARNEMFAAHENVLFIHTGGNSGLFY